VLGKKKPDVRSPSEELGRRRVSCELPRLKRRGFGRFKNLPYDQKVLIDEVATDW